MIPMESQHLNCRVRTQALTLSLGADRHSDDAQGRKDDQNHPSEPAEKDAKSQLI